MSRFHVWYLCISSFSLAYTNKIWSWPLLLVMPGCAGGGSKGISPQAGVLVFSRWSFSIVEKFNVFGKFLSHCINCILGGDIQCTGYCLIEENFSKLKIFIGPWYPCPCVIYESYHHNISSSKSPVTWGPDRLTGVNISVFTAIIVTLSHEIYCVRIWLLR